MPGKAPNRAFCISCGAVADLKHGTAEEHECAKCGSDMAPFTYKSVSLKPINVFRTGKWKGFTYTVKHLDEMVANFKAGVIRAYLKLTEDGSHGSVQRPLLSSLAFGWVDTMVRKGERLYASFKQVPEEVAKLIAGGALSQKSIEVWPNFHTTDGKKRGAALEAILFFGTGLPAVHDLEDAAEMYTRVDSEGEKHEIALDEMTAHDPAGDGTGAPTNNPGPPGGGQRRPAGGNTNPQEKTVEIQPNEYQILVADQAKLKFAEEQTGKFKAEAEKLTADLSVSKSKVETLTKERDDAISAVADSKKSTVEAFVATVVKTGQLEPARQEAVVGELLKMTAEQAEDYQKRLQTLPTLFEGDGVKNTEPDDNPSGEPEEVDTEKRDKAIKAAMKADKTLTYTAADEKLFGTGGTRLV